MPRGIYKRHRRGRRRKNRLDPQQVAQKKDFKLAQTAMEDAANAMLIATAAEMRLGRQSPLNVLRRLTTGSTPDSRRALE